MALCPQHEPCQEKLTLRRVFISHGPGQEVTNWAKNLKKALEKKEYQFEVTITEVNNPSALAPAIKQNRKVIMLITKDYLVSEEYKIVIDYVGRLTSKNHFECLIPVLWGLKYRDLPEELQIGDAVPVSGPANDYPSITAGTSEVFAKIVEKLHEELPVLSTSTDGVAFGLAWGYYCGYLYWILRELKERIQIEYDMKKDDWDCGEDAILFPKLVAIIPKNRQHIIGEGVRKTSLSDFDENIQILTSRENGSPITVAHKVDFPGHPGKCYSLVMHKLTADGQEYLFCAEIPTTINTLAIMGDPAFNCVQFSEEDYGREVERFRARVNMILRNHGDEATQSRRENFKILQFGDGDNLSEMLAKGIQRDIDWAKTPWQMD